MAVNYNPLGKLDITPWVTPEHLVNTECEDSLQMTASLSQYFLLDHQAISSPLFCVYVPKRH